MEHPAKGRLALLLGTIAPGIICQSLSCSPGTSPADPTVRSTGVSELGASGEGASDHAAPADAAAAQLPDASPPSAAAPAEDASLDAASADAADADASASDADAPPPELADEDAGIDPITLRRHPPDANIHFDWEETLPGRKLCEPGHYTGSFMCDLVFDNGSVAHLQGPVELTLARSQNGEFLELSDAHIEGFTLFIFNFRAQLTGRLACATRELDAMAVSGAVGLGDADLLPVLAFEGRLHGMLDDAGDVLSGEWSFPVTSGGERLGVCTGPWMATRVMP